MARLSGILLLVCFSFTSRAQSGPTNLNVSGALYSPSGAIITQSGVNFRLEIWDKNSTCKLYSEEHLNQDLSQSKGGFALAIGRGTSPNNLLESSAVLTSRVFENNGVIAGGWPDCLSGATLADGDERVIRVHYDLGGGFIAMTPDVPIASSAYAMVAETLQGRRPSDLVQVRDDATYDLSQANVENVFSSANYARLLQLLNPSAAIGFGSQRLTNISNPSSAQDAATKDYSDTFVAGRAIGIGTTDVGLGIGGGKVLTWDQVGNRWVATAATISGTAGGDLSGSYPNPTVANLAIGTSKLADNAVTSAKINNVGVATNRILITDNVAGANVTYAVCANNEILKFVTGVGWQCATVASLSAVTSVAGKSGAVTLNAADIGGLGTAALRDVGVAATEIPVLDGAAKLAVSTIPDFAGDVTGAYTNAYVARLQGRDVANVNPNANDVLRWNGSRWEPSALVDNVGITALNGDITAAGSGVVSATIVNNAVTTPKMFTNPGTNRLVATDNTTGATLVPFVCNLDETMKWTASGWGCTTVGNLLGSQFIVDGGNSRGAAISIGTSDNFDLNFETNNATRMTILNTGFVGIGTTAPTRSLHIVSDTYGAVESMTYSASQESQYVMRRSRGTQATPSPVLTGDLMGSVVFGGQFSGGNTVGATLSAVAEEDWTGVGRGTYLTFATKNAGTNTITSKMRLSSTGNLGIGTTSPARLLHVAGPARFEPAALPAGSAGDLAFDSASGNTLKFHNGASWQTVGTSSATGDFMANGSVDMTGTLKHLAGNAASPGLTFTGDTDNGIFAPAADNLAFGTSGAERMRILANGNVGIGTTNPLSALEVNGRAAISQLSGGIGTPLHITNSHVALMQDLGVGIDMRIQGIPTGLIASAWSANGSNANTYLSFQTRSSSALAERVRIAPDGYVGIGTTTPARLLHVAGPARLEPSALPAGAAGDLAFDSASGNTLKFHNGAGWQTVGTSSATGDFMANGSVDMTGTLKHLAGNAAAPGLTFAGDTDNGIFAPAADNLAFGTSAAERMRILANGNIGVGTTTAPYLLSLPVLGTLGWNKVDGTPGSQIWQIDNQVTITNGSQAQTLTITNRNDGVFSGINLGGGNSATGSIITGAGSGGGSRSLTVWGGGSGDLILGSNGAERMRFVSGGNIGIGTSAPNRLLEVAGPVRIAPALLPGSPAAGDLAIDSGAGNSLKYHNGSSWISLAVGGTGDFLANGTVPMTGNLRLNGNFLSGDGGSEGVYVDSAGLVGIGTTSPSVPLQVNGRVWAQNGVLTNQQFLFGDSTMYLNSFTSGASSYLNTIVNNTEVMRLQANGHVGIGTTLPAANLEVSVNDFNAAGGGVRFSDSAANGYMMMIDGTATPGAFMPTLQGLASGSARFTLIDAVVKAGEDVGSSPALALRSRLSGSSLSNRPVLAVMNDSTQYVTVAANGQVGIAVTNPARLLHVAGPARLEPTALPAGAAGDLAFDSASGNTLKFHNGTSWQTVGTSSATGDFLANGTVPMTGNLRLNGNFLSGDGGSEGVYVDAAGQVGVGTTAPGAAFDVNGIIVSRDYFQASSGSAAYPSYTVGGGATGAGIFYPAAGTLGFATVTAERMRIDSSGNVGIGTTAATSRLTLPGNQNKIEFKGFSAQNAPTYIYSDASDNLILDFMGGVGKSLHVYDRGGAVNVASFRASTVGHSINGNLVITNGTTANDALAIRAIAAQTAPLQSWRDSSNNLLAVVDNAGKVGLGLTSPARLLHSAGAIRINPAVLPASPDAGDLAFDSGAGNALKYHNGSTWVSLAAGGAPAGSNSQVQFNNGGSFGANANFVWDNSNSRLGIGVTAPGFPLEVSGIVSAGEYTARGTNGSQLLGLSIANSNTTANTGTKINFNSGSGGGVPMAAIGHIVESTTTNGAMTFSTRLTAGAPAERMRINSAGNVGIGTTAPSEKLHVVGGITANSLNDNSSGDAFYINTASTAPGPGSVYINDSEAKPIFEAAPIGTRTNYSWLRLDGGTDTQMPHVGSFANATNPGLSLGASDTQTLNILPSGNVGIGTTSPVTKLDVSGHIANSGAAATLGSCGTATISGNDTRGRVAITGGNITSCVINFNTAYTTVPYCVVSWEGGYPITIGANASTTALTAGFSSGVVTGTFNYICMQ